MIKIESLVKEYVTGDISVKAVNNVSFTVNKGEFVSIMGPSGSGKSTMMNVLGCLDKPTHGKYSLDGIEIEGVDDKELSKIRNRKLGFVFQSFNLLPKLTAIDNVELPMFYARISKEERYERAYRALKKVGLEKRIMHRPNELSGGQRQRVAIARSLVNNPAVMLADEPTGNLDSKSEAEIINIFKELNSEGVTIVMVTHEESVAANTKRIIRFRDGIIEKDEIVRVM